MQSCKKKCKTLSLKMRSKIHLNYAIQNSTIYSDLSASTMQCKTIPEAFLMLNIVRATFPHLKLLVTPIAFILLHHSTKTSVAYPGLYAVNTAALLARIPVETVPEFNFHFELTLAPEAAPERERPARSSGATEMSPDIRGIAPPKWMVSVVRAIRFVFRYSEGGIFREDLSGRLYARQGLVVVLVDTANASKGMLKYHWGV